MTKPTAWMPIYWGDYLRDTSHLTAEEHGVYLLLIAHYWSTGRALPADNRKLAKMGRVNLKRWTAIKSTISEFFQVENGAWHHARIERELIAAFNNKEAAIRRGKHGAATRWGHRPSIDRAIVEDSSSPSPIKNHESVTTTSTDAARDPALNGGSGPRAFKPETSNERLARLAMESRLKLLRKGSA